MGSFPKSQGLDQAGDTADEHTALDQERSVIDIQPGAAGQQETACEGAGEGHENVLQR